MGNIDYGQDTQNKRFGRVKINSVKNSLTDENVQMMSFSRNIGNKEQYHAWKYKIDHIDDSELKQLLLLPKSSKFEQGCVGSGGHVKLTYENFPYTLDEQITERMMRQKYYQQSQICTIFEKSDKKIGDIKPQNIIINQQGIIKIIGIDSFPKQQNNFQKFVQDNNIHVYLAPQQLNQYAISTGEYPGKVDPCKAQVFSIGLTILSSCILEDCMRIYSKGFPPIINEQQLKQYLKQVKNNYSQLLYNIVSNMLAINPNRRKKSSEIYQYIQSIKDQIFYHQQMRSNSNFYKYSQSLSHLYNGDDQNLQHESAINNNDAQRAQHEDHRIKSENNFVHLKKIAFKSKF